MHKLFFALGVFLIGILSYSTAYAGTINSYEQEVITYAQGTFSYKDVLYKVDDKYISMLRDYLMDDGVDLTVAQRDKVFQLAGSYIETGVIDGYLIPVDEETVQVDTDTSLDNSVDIGNSSISTPVSTDSNESNDNTDKHDNGWVNDSEDNADIEALTNNSSNELSNNIPEKTDGESIDIITSGLDASNTNKSNSSIKANDSSAQANHSPSANSNNVIEDNSEISARNEFSKESFLTELLDILLATDEEAVVEASTEGKMINEPVVEQVSIPIKKDTIANNTVTMNNPITRATENNLYMTYAVLVMLSLLMLAGIIATIRLNKVKDYE